jgi:hypothetical protein
VAAQEYRPESWVTVFFLQSDFEELRILERFQNVYDGRIEVIESDLRVSEKLNGLPRGSEPGAERRDSTQI